MNAESDAVDVNDKPGSTELERLTEKLPVELKETLTELWEMDRAAEQKELRDVWKLGQLMAGLDKEDYTTDEQGNTVDVFRIAARLHQCSVPYRASVIQFFRSFPTKEELKQFLSLKMRSGRGLTWPHVIELLSFWPHSSDSCRREFNEWVAKVLENNWTAAQLRDAIVKHRKINKSNRAEGPRPLRVPRTLHRRLQKLQEQVDMLNRWLDEVYLSHEHSILVTLNSMDPMKIYRERAALETQLQEILKKLQRLHGQIQNMLKQYEAAITGVASTCHLYETEELQHRARKDALITSPAEATGGQVTD
jgi:hypothetical protein